MCRPYGQFILIMGRHITIMIPDASHEYGLTLMYNTNPENSIMILLFKFSKAQSNFCPTVTVNRVRFGSMQRILAIMHKFMRN